jgi:hypothetical protein
VGKIATTWTPAPEDTIVATKAITTDDDMVLIYPTQQYLSTPFDTIELRNNINGILLYSLPVDNPVMPENPFYIKWINQQGGWDYWMFGYRQYKDRSVSNQQTFNPYIQDQQAAKGFTSQVWIDGVEKVKVGSEGMSQDDFDCVSKVVYSPTIQWFCEATQLWQTITVDGDGKSENDTHDILKDIELTFSLPTPQLQF